MRELTQVEVKTVSAGDNVDFYLVMTVVLMKFGAITGASVSLIKNHENIVGGYVIGALAGLGIGVGLAFLIES